MSETFKYQNSLPQLPVPELADTTALYLKCIEPLVTPWEFERTKAAAQGFLENEGPLLQKKLMDYASSIYPNSWLMPYSRDIYLNMREPITIEGSYILEFAPFADVKDYLTYVSLLAHSFGCVFKELQAGTFPPVMLKDTPLCMKQFEGSLRGTKIPLKEKDDFVLYEYKDVHSFGVFYKNNLYMIRLIKEDGLVAEPSEILGALRNICENNKAYKEINFNTAAFGGSGKTAQILEALCEDSHNKSCVDEVNKAMFNIAIKNCESGEACINEKLYTDCTDIWPYKPLNIIVYRDNVCCFNLEHTYFDALTNIKLIERAAEKLTYTPYNEGSLGKTAKVTALDFNLAGVDGQLKEIKSEYMERVGKIDFAVFKQEGIPAKALKENGINVDFYYQMAFIYAQLKAYGKPRCTHESVSVTRYYDGRTSCVRSVSREALEFAAALSNSAGGDSGLMELFKAASLEHVSRVKAAKDFVCFIRHGAGLNIMYERFGGELGISKKPELLWEAGFVKYLTQEISTSTVGNNHQINIFSYSPQVDGGLGAAYITHDNLFITDISFCTERRNELDAFVDGLTEYFEKMNLLFSFSP